MGCTFSGRSSSGDASAEDRPDLTAPELMEPSSVDPVIRVPGEYPMAGVLSVKQITRPLTKPQPYRHCTTMTMGALSVRRNQFWRSRTGGSAEIWLAIRAAAEALLADDVILAAAILKINLKVRIHPGEFELTVSASTADTILDLKHSILELSSQQRKSFATIPSCEELRQRIVFMGQELLDTQVLGDVGADEFLILQVFLRPNPIVEVANQ